MFAEELSGNASRKRQEEARARRRQLKQQQQRRSHGQKVSASVPSTTDEAHSNPKSAEGQSASSVASTTSATVPLSESSTIGGTSTVSFPSKSPPALPIPSVVSATTSSSSTSAPSAVAQALEQRRIRNQQKQQQNSATTIQSWCREHRSNVARKTTERAVFDKRMADLTMLGNILRQAKGTEYVAPPATVSSLAVQFLFVTGGIPRKKKVVDPDGNALLTVVKPIRMEMEDFGRFDKLLRHVLLPGIFSDDAELDSLSPWLSAAEGRVRLRKLLRVCLYCLTSSSVGGAAEASAAVDIFLRAMLGVTSKSTGSDGAVRKPARDALVKHCRQILLPVCPAPVSDGRPEGQDIDTLDLVRVLRYLLVYNTGGADPIPPNAEKMREACIPSKDRQRADVVFNLALDAIECLSNRSQSQKLQTRFFAEIFTVPLLTWKVSPLSVAGLITSKAGGAISITEPALIAFLKAFAEKHAAELSCGKAGSVLPTEDVPLTVCPAPNVLCLLANLVQMGRLCACINGSDATKLNYKAAEIFFDFLATLIDLAPLGTFTARRSAVEWVTHGAHHTPIVLSNVVIDQCKMILVDSYVRELFTSAIDNEALNTERTIQTKNDKDLKHEKDMVAVGSSSAATLAAKEAMIDRNKSFWQSSKWARKLSKTVSSLLSGDNPTPPQGKKASTSKGSGKLVNTSSVSRQLAHGRGSHRNVASAILASEQQAAEEAKKPPPTRPAAPYSAGFLFALCRAYGSILSRWGGGGKEDIVRRFHGSAAASSNAKDPETQSGEASAIAEPCVLSLLNVICFATGIVKTLWAIVQSDTKVVTELYSVIDSTRSSIPIRSLKARPIYNCYQTTKQDQEGNVGAVVLFVFVCCLSHILIITDDIEIHEMEKPLPPHQLRRCILLLKKLLYRACCVDDVHKSSGSDTAFRESNYFGLALIASSSRTMRDLYDRSSRRPLCVPKLWLVEDLLEKDIRRGKSHGDFTSLLSTPVLRVCPFLVSFKRRLRLFERIVTTDRINVQGSNEQQNLKAGIVVRIMRGRVLEDGLIHLNNLGRNMRQRLVVQYLNQAGAKEVGIDVGGLFKEFWTDLSNLAFDPNYALFRVTEGSGNCLYPNPSSRAAHGSDHIVLFEFLGRILGKALYEGITIQPQFAHFFLSFLRGDYNFLHMLSDLSTMDPQLYNNLMFLKTYEGDAADLCLTFTVANDDFGGNLEVPLIPNGGDVEVTNTNKQRYIGLVAKHHVCDRVKEQSEAFTRGLWEVIDRSWLRLFNEPELQVLISGATDGKIDVADMKANSRYTGGYTVLDKNVYRFWNVVSSLNSKQQADLLRFVTSCERPPPLGFASMNPPFTIQRVGIMRDGDKLPTASTCFNTLKLPTYSSERVLRERLIYAIEAGAGFELT